jgi:hypothetical protein
MNRLNPVGVDLNLVVGEYSIACKDPEFFGKFEFELEVKNGHVIIKKDGQMLVEQNGPLDEGTSSNLKGFQIALLATLHEIYEASQGCAEGFEGQCISHVKAPIHENYLLDLLMACKK